MRSHHTGMPDFRPLSRLLSPFSPGSRAGVVLRDYFRSGWAFLIPYLAAYLLYAWLKWPVNPGRAGEGVMKGMSESAGATASLLPAPCSLLHLYWFLHALHLILGALALRAWWQSRTSEQSTEQGTITSVPPSPFSLLLNAAPWICLGLLFWIPGVYLEWPSDPWEHLRRINEWRALDIVTAHSSWMKSSYFFPYSMLSWTVGLRQIYWLDFYYTGICLLLCWQYYRLARACDLGERASMIFVLMQALLFGNNIFSFYRYYGISSSIYAQLGAVALTRITLDTLRPREESGTQLAHRILQYFAPCALLLILTAFNHPQGLGIAGLGVLAVIVSSLLRWRRLMAVWLGTVALFLSVMTVLWYPRHSVSVGVFQAQGWLNACYGLNFTNPTSVVYERSMHILGLYGFINFAASMWLLWRNKVTGWLALMPFIALSLPCFALPLVTYIAPSTAINELDIFNRLLFSIPFGLSLITVLSCMGPRSSGEIASPLVVRLKTGKYMLLGILSLLRSMTPLLGSIALCSALTIPTGVVYNKYSPYYNRAWHALTTTPTDLRLRDVLLLYTTIQERLSRIPESIIVTTQAGSALLTFYPSDLLCTDPHRTIGTTNFQSLVEILANYNFIPNDVTPGHRVSVLAHYIEQKCHSTNLVEDINTNNPQAWSVLTGPAPNIVCLDSNISGYNCAIQNTPGRASAVFTSALIHINKFSSYKLRISARQKGASGATAYLAVAWYDIGARLLESNISKPIGAGNPAGWSNGLFSYFGLVSETPPNNWRTYEIYFGVGHKATIPGNAHSVRIGMLLNNDVPRSGIIQVANVQLYESDPPVIGLLIPDKNSLFSVSSQAAFLSGHWSPWKVMLERKGYAEVMVEAIRAAPDAIK